MKRVSNGSFLRQHPVGFQVFPYPLTPHKPVILCIAWCQELISYILEALEFESKWRPKCKEEEVRTPQLYERNRLLRLELQMLYKQVLYATTVPNTILQYPIRYYSIQYATTVGPPIR